MLHKQIQKITKIGLGILGGTILTASLTSTVIFADASTVQITCVDGQQVTLPSQKTATADFQAACTSPVDHGGYKPETAASSASIPELDTNPKDCKATDLTRDNCQIVRYLVIFINVLSAIVGVVVTGVIVWGGIEYSTSGGDPGKVQAAKKKIYNGVFSLVAFIFTYAFLQYIVPGGVL